MRAIIPIKQAKNYLGYRSDSSTYVLIDKDRKFQELFFKIGGNVVCFEDELVDYIEQRRQSAPAYAGGDDGVALRAIRFTLRARFGWSEFAPPR